MTTPEQQAREMLAALELPFMAEAFSASRLAPLANLVAENTALKAELEAIKQGAGEPVAWVKRSVLKPDAIHGDVEWLCSEGLGHGVLLYTRPCAPLTEADIDAIFDDHNDAPTMSYRYLVARAIEAHIKGAKGC